MEIGKSRGTIFYLPKMLNIIEGVVVVLSDFEKFTE